MTSDGATDSSITEKEIVFVCYSSKGVPFTKFVGLKQPISPNASGLHKAIMAALGDVGLGEEDLKKKLVGFGSKKNKAFFHWKSINYSVTDLP